jgi:uncharacterized protein YcfL
MKNSLFTCGALTLACLALGCAKSVNDVNISSNGQYSWIQTDPWLANIAQVQSVNKEFTPDGILHVQVVVKNTDHVANRIRWRYVWVDQNGMEVDTPLTTWETIRLEGKQTKALNGAGPNSRAKDCRLELKRVDIGGT